VPSSYDLQYIVHFSVALMVNVQVCLFYQVFLGDDRDYESWRSSFNGRNGQQPIRIVIMGLYDVVESYRRNVLIFQLREL
jgi:hypothetical protein